VTRESIWTRAYIMGLNPAKAAELAAREYDSTHPPSWTQAAAVSGGARAPRAPTRPCPRSWARTAVVVAAAVAAAAVLGLRTWDRLLFSSSSTPKARAAKSSANCSPPRSGSDGAHSSTGPDERPADGTPPPRANA